MPKDRRYGARRAVNQEVMIIHDQGHRLCRIHDLSVDGAMLDLGWGALTRDVPVELAISFPSTRGRISYRLPARVARITTKGTAIQFGDIDVDVRAAMRRYLQSVTSPPRPDSFQGPPAAKKSDRLTK